MEEGEEEGEGRGRKGKGRRGTVISTVTVAEMKLKKSTAHTFRNSASDRRDWKKSASFLLKISEFVPLCADSSRFSLESVSSPNALEFDWLHLAKWTRDGFAHSFRLASVGSMCSFANNALLCCKYLTTHSGKQEFITRSKSARIHTSILSGHDTNKLWLQNRTH